MVALLSSRPSSQSSSPKTTPPSSPTVSSTSPCPATTTPRKRRTMAYTCREKVMILGMLSCVLGMFHKARLFQIADMSLSSPELTPEQRTTAAVTRPVVLPTLPPLSAATTITEPPVTTLRVRPDPHQHALLIPYRNRTFHLERFLEYMRPYLQRHFPDDVFTLYVVEQDDDTLFNRGWLTNVGLDTIREMAPQTQCITLHDVDLIPNGTSHVPYTSCVDRPIHLATKMENFNWAIPYGQYCGGITALSLTHWQEINGMSNDYQGWGGEDDDLWHRMRLNGLLMHPQPDPKLFPQPVRPNKPGEGVFRTISQAQEHHSQQRDHDNKKIIQKMLEAMWKGSDRWLTEGWNDAYYMLTAGINVTELSTEPMDMPEWTDRPLYVPPPKKNSTAFNSTAANNRITAANNKYNYSNNKAASNYSSIVSFLRNSGYAKVHTMVRTSTSALTAAQPTTQPTNSNDNSNIAQTTNTINSKNNMQEEEGPYSKPLGRGIDKVVHIKAVALRGRNQLALTEKKLATDQGLPVLELVDIPYTGADLLTRAAARSNIVWGACHWQVSDDCAHAQNSGDFRHRFTLSASYAQAQFPWHMPHSPWQADPLEGAVRFTVVQHPYARALDFFRTWYDVQHRQEKMSSNVSEAEYVQQREQPHHVNSFLQRYLNQTDGQWSAPTWMRGVMDLMPLYDVFQAIKSTSYISRTLKYEDIENEWRDLAMQYNYTSTGIDEQISQLIKEKKARESQATAWLQPNQLEQETIDLLNNIYPNDFKVFLDYKSLPGTGKHNLNYRHPRTKNHKAAVPNQPLEMVAIPYTGAVGSLTRAAARAGIVWGACHFDDFEKWECPADESGDYHDSLKVTMNGVTEFEAPWYVQTKLWSRNPYADPFRSDRTLSKSFTVVRHPYDRAIAFYRHMYDREHGYYDGFLPIQDEDALLDPSSFEMNEYLQQREDAGRMNAWLQKYFSTLHHPYRPHGMELIPQYKYTFRIQHIIKYEELTSGLDKYVKQYPASGKNIDLQVFQEYETKRANYTKAMKMHRGPKMLERGDLSSLTVVMINEIYSMDFTKWYRMEKRIPDKNFSTSRHWRQPQAIPGQRRVG